MSDALAEPPVITAEPQLTTAQREHAFTSENARIMAARSWEVRRKRALENPPSVPPAQPQPLPCDDYVSRSLARVREHLARIDAQLERTKDEQAIERLVRARGVLGEQERVLDGRPLPGSRRPGKEKTERPPDLEPV